MTRVFAAVSLAIVALLSAVPDARAAVCDDLARYRLPGGTITGAQVVAAGAFRPGGLVAAASAGPQTTATREMAGFGAAGNAATRAYAALPEFCRVLVTLTPTTDSDIKVEVWLPTSGWNGKFQAVGNGGMAGTIPYPALAGALASGYATAGTDTGHVGNNADFVPGHPEKLVDFAYRAIHEMTVASKAVITAHYGAAPKRSYFNGCSQGGRQGITSAQRYPQDFDGIVAGASAWNQMRSHGARMAVNRFMNRAPGSHIPEAKYPAIHRAVLQACDALDGVTDGLLENPTRCAFDPKVLACTGADTPSCLTPAQVESARAMLSPVTHPATGKVLFEGHLWPGSELEWDTIGGPQPLRNASTALTNIAFAPGWDYTTFNPATDIDRADAADKDLLDSNNADLRPFFKRGGKLLMWHGWADPQVTPQNSTIYFSSVLKTVGPSARESIELFMLPGVYHCQGGPGPDRFDRMAALEHWVEQGTKPARLVASKVENGAVVRTRPLCPFGQVAKWKGAGSTDDERSFVCAAEHMDTADWAPR